MSYSTIYGYSISSMSYSTIYGYSISSMSYSTIYGYSISSLFSCVLVKSFDPLQHCIAWLLLH